MIKIYTRVLWLSYLDMDDYYLLVEKRILYE